MSEDFCRHINVTEEGYCTECGVLARVRFPLEKRKPMSSEISYAVETFEEACDEAIAKIGEENAYRILCQRKERAQIILRMAPKEKNVLGGRYSKDPGDLPDFSRQMRGVSEQEAAHAKAEAERQQYAEDMQHAEDIKALNKSMGL
jgi:hypothetical protein